MDRNKKAGKTKGSSRSSKLTLSEYKRNRRQYVLCDLKKIKLSISIQVPVQRVPEWQIAHGYCNLRPRYLEWSIIPYPLPASPPRQPVPISADRVQRHIPDRKAPFGLARYSQNYPPLSPAARNNTCPNGSSAQILNGTLFQLSTGRA